MRSRPRSMQPLVALLVLFGFGLRVLDLTGRSMWGDESYTLYRVMSEWTLTLRNQVAMPFGVVNDPHPQLFFALLKLWMEPAGRSEFGLKLLSALFGTLAIPVAYATSVRMFGRRTGLLAAAFFTLSPALIWYSDELRMYALVPLVAVAAAYLLFSALERHSLRRALLGSISIVVGLLTHYSFIGLAAGHALMILWLVYMRRGRWLGARSTLNRDFWLPAIIVALGVAAIIIGTNVSELFARVQSRQELDFYFVPLSVILETLFGSPFFGLNFSGPGQTLVAWVIITVSVGGLTVIALRRRDRHERLAITLLGVSTFVPILVWYGASFFRPNFQGLRHLILVVPPILIGTAHVCVRVAEGGLRQLRRIQPHARVALPGLLPAFALLVAQGIGIAADDPPQPRSQDDWRSMGHYLRDHWQPGDVLLSDPAAATPSLSSYAGAAPFETVSTAQLSRQETNPLTAVLAGANRIWFVSQAGKEIAVSEGATWLRDMLIVDDQRFASRGLDLRLFALDPHPEVVDVLPAQTLSVTRDSIPGVAAQVAGFALKPGSPYAANPSVTLSVYWRRLDGPLPARAITLRVSSHLEGWLDWSQTMVVPATPATWTTGRLWRQDYSVPLPVGLPRRDYRVQLGVEYDAPGATHVMLDTVLPAELVASTLRVANWPPQTPEVNLRYPPMATIQTASGIVDTRTQLLWREDEISLVRAIYSPAVYPGEPLPVGLLWRPEQPGLALWHNEVSLEPLIGGAMVTVTRESGDPAAAVGAWTPGELYRDQVTLRVPQNVVAGQYRLTLTRTRNGQRLGGGTLGFLTIEERPRSPRPTPSAQPLNATLGPFSVLGYTPGDPPGRGATMSLRVGFVADAAPTEAAALFIHILDASGRMVAQRDLDPLDGARSTLSYRAGEGLDQSFAVPIPRDLPAGDYRVLLGAYRRADLTRWPARVGGTPAQHDLIDLFTFTLKPMDAYHTFVPNVGR
ncbi:MAG: glycosyltransferase family 39 protein [Thermoflexales bacterium]|nr:glycosyltransferase family 39 protein [Thermoflexales bacterium]